MLFNSWVFLFAFLPLTLGGFFVLGRQSAQRGALWLAVASLVFYGWWSVAALPLLLGSILLNYGFASHLSALASRGRNSMHGSEAQGPASLRALLAVALVANLSLLGYFKYANFFLANANSILGQFGISPLAELAIVLPIGISFYTFTQIAFLVDCAQGKVRERSFTHYLLFVTYFPHLIAGPVLHHAQMMPQFARPETYRPDLDRIALGIAVFVFGLAKKLIIADPLGAYADAFFSGVAAGQIPTLAIAWIGMIAYSLQIYYDFSGYTDMAIGASLLFGIALPINFASPYQARSIIDFWRRWHISLSNFLRDYLYIPLGGNRHGSARRHLNLVATMLLGGLWHGASWTFVLWGGAHGMLLVINHLWRSARERFRSAKHATTTSDGSDGSASWMWRALTQTLAWLLTLLCIVLTWVLFRAESLQTAGSIYLGLFGLNGGSLDKWGWIQLAIGSSEFWQTLALGLILALFAKPVRQYFERGRCFDHRWIVPRLLIVGATFCLCLGRLGQHSPFLYFQF